MIETFTHATFADRLGEPFRVLLDDSRSAELRLAQATVLGSASAKRWAEGGGREPFTLVFRGSGDAVLPQRTYRMENDETGAFDVFLVPIGPDAEGMRYEAVFT